MNRGCLWRRAVAGGGAHCQGVWFQEGVAREGGGGTSENCPLTGVLRRYPLDGELEPVPSLSPPPPPLPPPPSLFLEFPALLAPAISARFENLEFGERGRGGAAFSSGALRMGGRNVLF